MRYIYHKHGHINQTFKYKISFNKNEIHKYMIKSKRIQVIRIVTLNMVSIVHSHGYIKLNFHYFYSTVLSAELLGHSKDKIITS